MTNIEIYINGILCDVTGNMDVPRLNRVLLVPGEVFARNAQYSYSITLPFTSRNNEAFGNVNIEEVSGKFEREYDAEVVVNSVHIFKGSFLLTEIDDGYKGNLFLAWHKSVKDIFEGKKLRELAEYKLNFGRFANSVSAINANASDEPQPAIFPYVLYGLLPKVPTKDGYYTSKTLWDQYVRMGIDDMPPSVNVMLLLEHMLRAKGYSLTGSAFLDKRMRNLYMSCKMSSDEALPWNWNTLGRFSVTGRWYNRDIKVNNSLELGVSQNNADENKCFYACDLFQSTNCTITSVTDNCGMFKFYTETKDNRDWLRANLLVPVSGYYKVSLKTNLTVEDEIDRKQEKESKIWYLSGGDTSLDKTRYEFKLLRDRKEQDFDLSSSVLDGVFYWNNMKQYYNQANHFHKYFPIIEYQRQVNLVDYCQNPKFVVGHQWGFVPTSENSAIDEAYSEENRLYAQILAAKPAYGLDGKDKDRLTRLAIKSPGYQGYVGKEMINKKKYEIQLNGAPANVARRIDSWHAEGATQAVVWLEKGEMLTLMSTSPETYTDKTNGWGVHAIDFTLTLEPFRSDPEWLKVDNYGNGTAPMNYADKSNFLSAYIDLMKFLPDDMTADAFIDGICKTFNLKLSQIAPKQFSLDFLQSYVVSTGDVLDLDGIATLRGRTNSPLEIPSVYRFGFSVKEDEQGYVETEDNGSCEVFTRKTDGDEFEMKSPFSYGWYKTIIKDGEDLRFPIISKAELWAEETDYAQGMDKRSMDLQVRFWFYEGVMKTNFRFMNSPLKIAQVSNTLDGGKLDISYKNYSGTLFSELFTVFSNCSTCYTEIECFLKPQEYARLDGSVMVRFNGDLYYVAEVSGYDPSGRNKTKLKLIRKI